MDHLSFIMAVETDLDSLSPQEYIEGCAALLKSRLVFQLQGSWQRAVMALHDAGIIDSDGNVLVNADEIEALA